MKCTLFSIIIVCLNPGDKLKETFESVKKQTFRDFEVIIKDGESTDGSVEKLTTSEKELLESPVAPYLKVVAKKDSGIYDAMNQAVEEASGEYILFLNCGDKFADEKVLEKVTHVIKENPGCGIYYGDTFCEKTGDLVVAPGKITGFTCYRNIPCHQSCFYHRDMFEGKNFELDYKIRADYDHFLHCFYKKSATPKHTGITVASYEGGGYSENKENRKRDKLEHEIITAEYMTKSELLKYKATMAATLAPLRTYIAETPALSGAYQGVKKAIYKIIK